MKGWDTHIGQGATGGVMALLLGELAMALSVFANRMEDRKEHLTVCVMSEFGRRVAENGSLGTDHGEGGVMLLWGGHIAGGHVFGD